MIEFQDAKRIAAMMAAIGETTRLLILHRLTQGPHHVGQLAELIGIPMVNMSHHLGVMRQAGLLEDEKDGRRVVYKFRPEVYTEGGDSPDVVGTLKIGPYRLSICRPADEEGGSKGGRKKGSK
jgi:DNA-binding transcriptional ArsR family regulator